jgi:hypothetical protein
MTGLHEAFELWAEAAAAEKLLAPISSPAPTTDLAEEAALDEASAHHDEGMNR